MRATSTELPQSTAAFYDVTTVDPEIAKRRTDELAERLTWSRDEILKYQTGRLHEILRHAATASPYFRETIGHLVEADAPLSAYPVMNKTVLMAELIGS